jgi:hypothetical protein
LAGADTLSIEHIGALAAHHVVSIKILTLDENQEYPKDGYF